MQTDKEIKTSVESSLGRELFLSADSGNTEEKMISQIEEDNPEQTEEKEE
ncbi:MAG TPA: hypothetical protein VFL47_03090 [Flavisolibacter sp.]|nr:hypothetical protein [Flavisolibacter sp.]